MSSSNYRRNEAAIRKFRKELMDMVDDIREIDKRCLTRLLMRELLMLNEGRR